MSSRSERKIQGQVMISFTYSITYTSQYYSRRVSICMNHVSSSRHRSRLFHECTDEHLVGTRQGNSCSNEHWRHVEFCKVSHEMSPVSSFLCWSSHFWLASQCVDHFNRIVMDFETLRWRDPSLTSKFNTGESSFRRRKRKATRWFQKLLPMLTEE